MRFEKAVDILEVAVRIERHSVKLRETPRRVRPSRGQELFSLPEEGKHLGSKASSKGGGPTLPAWRSFSRAPLRDRAQRSYMNMLIYESAA